LIAGAVVNDAMQERKKRWPQGADLDKMHSTNSTTANRHHQGGANLQGACCHLPNRIQLEELQTKVVANAMARNKMTMILKAHSGSNVSHASNSNDGHRWQQQQD